MSEEVSQPLATMEEVEKHLRDNPDDAVQRIKARMACCALGLVHMSTEEVSCAKAVLNKHQADAKAVEQPQTLNVNLNGTVQFVEPEAK